jgi:hypothetical protein
VTAATKPAKKTVRKTTTAKKAAPTKTAAKRPVRERKLGAVVKSAVAPKTAPARKRAAVVQPVAEKPVEAAPQPRPTKGARSLVAKVRARRKVVLPFRERLEEAMHRELKHDGPICHPCRMNASRLAALAV